MKKDFFKNNVGILFKTDIYINDEIFVHPDLTTSFILTTIQLNPGKISRKAFYLLQNYHKIKKQPDFEEQWFPTIKIQYDIFIDKKI